MQPDAPFRAEASPPTGFDDMMGVMAVELTDLGMSIDGLQDLIGRLAELAGPTLGHEFIVRLQDIDSVSQRLARLAQLAQILRETARGGEFPLLPTPELLEALRRLDGARGRPLSD